MEIFYRNKIKKYNQKIIERSSDFEIDIKTETYPPLELTKFFFREF
jgi:hypothetical protein